MVPGRTYNLEGTIQKWDDGATTAFHLEGNRNNQEVCAEEIIDLGPMTIGGIGSIARASVKASGSNNRPMWELIVVHGPMRDRTRSVRVRYLLSVDELDVLLDTEFKIGSQIYLIGALDSVGPTTGIMVVNVTQGMYYKN
ncbi:hypothetical protein MJO28_014475 [Puccinia striiformis f. sp. tritici]|uniref:Uncharacterized protein n=1 Tax=Puccinia striiformis f. sp. tritici TaxID=168172 RepID=A0ACC0DUA1_9BASI|nr:hypothetical protein MJO28_014475 [Puccinia striiformis f. sp. tritici]